MNNHEQPYVPQLLTREEADGIQDFSIVSMSGAMLEQHYMYNSPPNKCRVKVNIRSSYLQGDGYKPTNSRIIVEVYGAHHIKKLDEIVAMSGSFTSEDGKKRLSNPPRVCLTGKLVMYYNAKEDKHVSYVIVSSIDKLDAYISSKAAKKKAPNVIPTQNRRSPDTNEDHFIDDIDDNIPF